MNKTLKVIGFVLFCQLAVAQNEADVLRYSTTDVFGSARFEAMAGSFGALGADFSAIQINPADMGRFSSSRATVSFNNSFIQNSSNFNNTQTPSQRNKFAVGALGVVFATDISKSNKGRKYNQITLGYTRLKNFANHRKYEGQEYYSLLDVFANEGAGISDADIYSARPFTTGLAYDVYALDYDAGSVQYISRLTMGDMYHVREINTDGGIGEFHIGYSENYMNKLYYGASLGIRRVKYKEHINHNETLLDTVGTSLRSFNYTNDLESKGIGINLKLGLLYLPTEQFRVGLAFESPTLIRMNDNWTANMTATHNTGVNSILPEYVPEGKFNYRVKTPMKIRASFAYILGMRGAINVDLEMSRLTGGRLMPQSSINSSGGLSAVDDSHLFDYENDQVRQQFRTVLNTRIGIEYMIFNGVYLRGGIALLPQPYKKDLGNLNTPNMTYAGGLGWENKFLQIDLSYRLLSLSSDYYAFDPSKAENRARFKTNVHNIVLTASFKF